MAQFSDGWMQIEAWRQRAGDFMVEVRCGKTWHLAHTLEFGRVNTLPCEPQVGELVRLRGV